MLQHYKDYAVPLLRLLVELPGGWGTRADVSQQFLERHRDEIPERQFGRAANPSESHVERPRPARSLGREPAERPGATVVPRGITLEMLEQTRQVMSPDQFRQVWGAIYDQIVAEERRKAITPVNDRFLAEKTRVIVQRVQDFLQGRSTESPKSETVCDWIFICYNLELFREGAALWQYVNKDETNPWQYERTMRLSAACRARVSP
jgi:hypothetical protein